MRICCVCRHAKSRSFSGVGPAQVVDLQSKNPKIGSCFPLRAAILTLKWKKALKRGQIFNVDKVVDIKDLTPITKVGIVR
jgi:hypothetical protein